MDEDEYAQQSYDDAEDADLDDNDDESMDREFGAEYEKGDDEFTLDDDEDEE